MNKDEFDKLVNTSFVKSAGAFGADFYNKSEDHIPAPFLSKSKDIPQAMIDDADCINEILFDHLWDHRVLMIQALIQFQLAVLFKMVKQNKTKCATCVGEQAAALANAFSDDIRKCLEVAAIPEVCETLELDCILKSVRT